MIMLFVNATVVARTCGVVSSEFNEKHNNIELVKNPNSICRKHINHKGKIGPNRIKQMVITAPNMPKPINIVHNAAIHQGKADSHKAKAILP